MLPIYGPVITCTLGLIFFLVFTVKCHKQRSVIGVYIKSLTSVCFILTAITSGLTQDNSMLYTSLIVAGGVCGLLGDIYLDQKWLYLEHKDQYLAMGFLSFGIGHLFFLAAIILSAALGIKEILIAAAIGAVISIVNLFLEKPTKQTYGKFKGTLVAYAFILGTVLGMAFVAYLKTKDPLYLVFTIGAALFLISDIILSPMYFAEGKNTPVNFVLNHTTYYLAQFIIAITPCFLNQ